MNDEELRAFLDSATVGDEEDQAPASDAPSAEAAASGSPTGAAPRRGVPSFDELMNMGAPATEAPAQGVADQLASRTEAAASEQNASAAAGVAATSAEAAQLPSAAQTAPASPEWAQTYAQDDEELVPLILPGFSPEPSRGRELPPVFQADLAAAQSDAAQSAGQSGGGANSFDEQVPTQPFDVLADPQEHSAASAASVAAVVSPAAPASDARPEARAATPSAAAVSATSGVAAATAAAAASASTAPLANLIASQADQRHEEENPFAFLDSDSDSDPQAEEEYEPISVTGSEKRARKAMPWLIVGGGVAIALIASIFVINGVRGTESPETDGTPAVTSPPTTTEDPTTTEEPEPTEDPTPDPNVAPVVDPGSTYDLAITQWGLTVPRSEAFGGSTPYNLYDNDSRAMFTLPLAESLSATCAQAAAPEAWGLLKKEDGKLEVIRPEPRCTDPGDAAVYDKIWGLMDYMAKNPKPIQ